MPAGKGTCQGHAGFVGRIYRYVRDWRRRGGTRGKRGNGSGGDGSEISVFLAQHVSVLRFPGTYTRPVLLVSGGR